jgi:hypothetical protein
VRPANTDVVDAHYRHPLAEAFGDGTLSSTRPTATARPLATFALFGLLVTSCRVP